MFSNSGIFLCSSSAAVKKRYILTFLLNADCVTIRLQQRNLECNNTLVCFSWAFSTRFTGGFRSSQFAAGEPKTKTEKQKEK